MCKALAGQNDNRLEDALDGFLVYSVDHSNGHWMTDAMAVFKLATANTESTNTQTIMKKLKQKYSPDAPLHRVELIDWDTLLENYVRDDQFTVDVEVFVAPKRSTTIDMTRVAADFRVVVDDVSEFGQTVSPAVNVQGVGWTVVVKIDEEKVGVSLQLVKLNGGLDENEWSWNGTVAMSLLSVDDAQPITKEFTHLFSANLNWGFSDFVSHENFTKSYVQHDKATFVVNLKVDSPQPLWKINDELMMVQQ